MFCGKYYQQIKGIPMGVNCGPILANLYLHYYEFEYINNMIKVHKDNIHYVRQFNGMYRFIDDLLVTNSSFHEKAREIYPHTLSLTRQNINSDKESHFLDLDIKIINSRFVIKVYDKRDDFNFIINNFPHYSSNISMSIIKGVYISQLIRYARICTNITDFHERHRYLSKRLINNGYDESVLRGNFKIFARKNRDLLKKWNYHSTHNKTYITRGIIERNR